MLVVWCADWPLVAAGIPPDEPAAVFHANRVVACTAAARAEGVVRGIRRRDAQARCAGLTVLQHDPHRDARAFEAVAAAVEAMAPRVEIIRPGTLAVPARGPSRYYGGDQSVLCAMRTAVRCASRTESVGLGIADGLVAATLAARRCADVVVPPGESAAFLAPHPVSALARVLPDAPLLDLVGLFHRLGLRTLGDVAAVPPATLHGRFGALGVSASRIARGLDERPPRPRTVEPELIVSMELDPPAERVDTAAFAARTLAAELADRLDSRGLVCTRVAIEVETEHDEALSRLWRHEGGLGPAAMADRVRWQLDGWLNRSTWGDRPTGGISLLRLVPDQVVPDDGRQLGFWGGAREADERAARGVARLQGLLGPDAVGVPERRGGRGPGEQLVLVPAHTVRTGTVAVTEAAAQPWPGRLPAPSPAAVSSTPVAAEVLDAHDRPVRVSGRGVLSAEPVAVALGAARPVPIAAWCGPWPYDERWWDPITARRRARIQVVTEDGTARLLSLERGRWTVEATYD